MVDVGHALNGLAQRILDLVAAEREALADLSASFPALCTLETFPNKSVEGRDIHFVKIANGTGPDRPRVVLLGGVHARNPHRRMR